MITHNGREAERHQELLLCDFLIQRKYFAEHINSSTQRNDYNELPSDRAPKTAEPVTDGKLSHGSQTGSAKGRNYFFHLPTLAFVIIRIFIGYVLLCCSMRRTLAGRHLILSHIYMHSPTICRHADTMLAQLF